ncbi:hypothetical protein ACO0K2_19545 [Undibacterium sp. MH2W]|uniref:hypothetical protein n=1 Tax=Undibacterium sp. MH2W TaxID=3413044 RepID=UPI003BEF6274
MSEYVLLHMWDPFREMLIERHKFYVAQERIKLLSRFDDMECEANNAANEWIRRASRSFDADQDDIGAVYEAADAERIALYQLLKDMHKDVSLAVVAGMFHEWDKQLRHWLVHEIRHWHHGDEVRAKVWAQDFCGIVEFFSCLGWDIRNRSYFPMLDACRLVVNVYKHGNGKSFQDLKQRYSEYLDIPSNRIAVEILGMDCVDFRDLTVTEAQIDRFSDAIISFWGDVPKTFHDDID